MLSGLGMIMKLVLRYTLRTCSIGINRFWLFWFGWVFSCSIGEKPFLVGLVRLGFFVFYWDQPFLVVLVRLGFFVFYWGKNVFGWFG